MIFEFGLILLAYRLFGNAGLYGMTVFCTIAANIEVTILVSAFGMEQTLGNVLFASSFVITDILSENVGKDAANKAAKLGIFVTAVFIVLTRSWMLYTPAEADIVMDGVRTLFGNTPRIMTASLVVFAAVQLFDVWMYHKLWNFTSAKFGNSQKYLWLRNNIATLTSQLINTVLFTLGAFWGIYPTDVLLNIMLSSYVIYIVTSLCDTPVVYIARYMKKSGLIPD